MMSSIIVIFYLDKALLLLNSKILSVVLLFFESI